MLLADEDVALVKLSYDPLVGIDEASKRRQKRGEAAFQPFHREDFHELSQIYLALKLLIGPIAFVILKRFVARVFEVVREGTNRFDEDFVLDLVEFVKEWLGVSDLGELETLFP